MSLKTPDGLQHFDSVGELCLLLFRPQLRLEALREHWCLLAHALGPTPLRLLCLEVCDHGLRFSIGQEVVDDFDGKTGTSRPDWQGLVPGEVVPKARIQPC